MGGNSSVRGNIGDEGMERRRRCLLGETHADEATLPEGCYFRGNIRCAHPLLYHCYNECFAEVFDWCESVFNVMCVSKSDEKIKCESAVTRDAQSALMIYFILFKYKSNLKKRVFEKPLLNTQQ